MKLKTFTEFINIAEDTIEPADQDLDVKIDDVLLDSGKEISAEQILGVIVSSKSEKDFIDYFYDKYGNDAFTETDIFTLSKQYNLYQEEINKKETEAEEEEGEGDDMDLGGGDEKDDEFAI